MDFIEQQTIALLSDDAKKLLSPTTLSNKLLTNDDIKLMQFSSTEMTNEVIAEEMNMPLGTFHKAKAQLHQILGIQTKQGITRLCSFLNLI
jgi:hypothetical protein